MTILTSILLTQIGCSSPPTSESLDESYSTIRYGLGIAERDTTRNIKDSEARERKIRREQAEVAFFNTPENMAQIEELKSSSNAFAAKKGEAYWRQAILERSWTQAEKEREEELLARIQAKRQEETFWTSPDGSVDVALSNSWSRIYSSISEPDADTLEDLQSAWVEARTSWMGEDLAALVRLRNEVARREGFATYWELALAHRGLSPEKVEKLSKKLEELIVPLNKALAEDRASLAEEHSIPNTWTHQPRIAKLSEDFPSGTSLDAAYDADLAEARLRMLFSDMGLNMEEVQVYPGPTRYTLPGAYGIAISPPENIAIVISKDRRWSAWHYQALAHEMGLAAWWRSLPSEAKDSPVLWDPPKAYFEGIGQFFERMATSREFASRIDDFDADLAENLNHWHWRSTIDGITHYLASTKTEQMLYERPGQWDQISKEAALIEQRLSGREWSNPTDDSGRPYVRSLRSDLMIHLPAYVQNYLFATATEASLWEAATKAMGDPVGNAKLGPWLRDNLVIPVSTESSFPDQLAELTGQSEFTAPLAEYLRSKEQ